MNIYFIEFLSFMFISVKFLHVNNEKVTIDHSGIWAGKYECHPGIVVKNFLSF